MQYLQQHLNRCIFSIRKLKIYKQKYYRVVASSRIHNIIYDEEETYTYQLQMAAEEGLELISSHLTGLASDF
jgi:hypothetical protein